MMKKNVYIAVAAMMMMGVSGTANAAWTVDSPNVNVAKQLTTATAGSALNSMDSSATVAKYTLAGNVPVNSRLTLTLSNGTFAANPTATPATAGLFTLPTGGALTLVGNPTGTNTATFVATNTAGSGNAQITGNLITFSKLRVNLTGLAAGATVDVALDIKDGVLVNQASDSLAGTATYTPVFTVVNAVTSKITSKSDIAEVTTGFLKFNGAPNTTTGKTFTVELDANAVALNAANDFVLITLTGNFAGVKSIQDANVTSATSTGADGKIDATAGTTVVGEFSINAAKTAAYARVTNSTIIPTGTPLAGTIHSINFVADGTTAQMARSFKLAADVVAGGGTPTLGVHNFQTASTAYTITRNGSSFVSNNLGAASRLHITNNDAAAGAVLYTVVDATGAAITQVGATLPTSIAAGATIDILGTTLATAFPGYARIAVNIESSNVDVTHIKKNASGLNTNVVSTNNAL